MRTAVPAAFALLGLAAAVPAHAWEQEFQGGVFDGWLLQWSGRASAGAAWRMQARDDRLIGKSSLDPTLCAPDDCLSFQAADTAPNDRFLAARGAASSNTDDGDLNYDPGDLVMSGVKLTSKIDFGTPDYGIEMGGLFFYDPVNTDFRETHTNRIELPGPAPGGYVRTKRATVTEHTLGEHVELREANAYWFTDSWLDQPIEVRVGRQVLHWGEAAVNVQGALNVVNPPDANALPRPGVEFQDIYRPASLFVVRGPVTTLISFEAFYQLEWRPYDFPARGSFFSFFDGGNAVEPDDYLVFPFGKAPEDPQLIGVPANTALRQVSTTSYSLARDPNRTPPDSGQYGVSLSWVLDDVIDAPLTMNFYYANYHSRLPMISARSADASCTRREGNARGMDTTTAAEFETDCSGRDALPIDTARWFFDYPKDIRMWGLSFETEALGLSVQGEFALRENQPIQVDTEDVLFTALQPAFPRNTIDVTPGSLTLAAATRAIPTYLLQYRGGTPGEVAPDAYVRGWERFRTLNATGGITKLTGANSLLWADEAVYLFELSGSYVPDLPPIDDLQLEGPGTRFAYTPGIADTGDALKINPKSNGPNGYVSKLAYGYRFASYLKYSNVLRPGLTLRPLVVVTHDIHGVGPGIAENFLDGRKIIVTSLQAQYHRWRADAGYTWFTGGGNANVLSDRDMFAVSVSWEF